MTRGDGRSLLACVGPRSGAEQVVRAAGRLAAQLGVDWQAVYVETPPLQRLPEADRRRVLGVLRLAESLGARTATLPGQDAAAAIAGHARTHGVSRVVSGRSGRRSRWPWQRDFAADLGRTAPELESIQVPAGTRGDAAPAPRDGVALQPADGPALAAYGITAAAMGIVTVALMPLLKVLEPSNIVMLFLLAVVGIALRLGRGPAALAAVLGVACFDFFFVPPRFTLAVTDVEYVVTFAVMLIVGLVVGQLTSGLRYQARAAAARERRADGLYRLARDLSAAIAPAQIAEIVDRFAREAIRGRARLLLPGADDRALQPASADGEALAIDEGIAQWSHDRGEPAGVGTDTLPGSSLLYLPLKTAMRCRGVLVVDPGHPRWAMVPEQRRVLETVATLTAIALERIHYVEVARDALVHMESERVRNALLASISHDLRTPLAGILGAATSLADLDDTITVGQRAELHASIVGEARRMNELVANVLQMARLDSGRVVASPQWLGMDEVVGAALRALEVPLASHPVNVHLPAGTMLVHVDPTLADQLLVNLLSNAARHTPPGTTVDVSAGREGDRLVIEVADRGLGFQGTDPARLFETFQHGRSESSAGGGGLGLSICRAIVELHGGTIAAEARDGGGAVFRVALPQPPLPDRAPEEFRVSAPRSIVVIEDEPEIRRFLRTALGTEGFDVHEATTGGRGLVEAGTRRPDLVILDLGLPDMDGLEVLRQLRTWSAVPVIVLSARTQETQKIVALDAGADDYVAKPFGIGELLARVRVALRHAGPARDTVFRADGLEVDLEARVVRVNAEEVHLTPLEFRLLAQLVNHAGKVLTHRHLLREVWGPSHADDHHYLRIYMSQLRQKIEADPARPRWLRTEVGVGYRFVDDGR